MSSLKLAHMPCIICYTETESWCQKVLKLPEKFLLFCVRLERTWRVSTANRTLIPGRHFTPAGVPTSSSTECVPARMCRIVYITEWPANLWWPFFADFFQLRVQVRNNRHRRWTVRYFVFVSAGLTLGLAGYGHWLNVIRVGSTAAALSGYCTALRPSSDGQIAVRFLWRAFDWLAGNQGLHFISV